MSHVVQVRNIQCKDEQALIQACSHLGLSCKEGTHQLFGSQKATGLAVNLPGWRYPVVIDTKTGEAKYDNYNGSWGKQDELDKLIQRYAIEAAKNEGALHGFQSVEHELENGDVRLEMVSYAP